MQRTTNKVWQHGSMQSCRQGRGVWLNYGNSQAKSIRYRVEHVLLDKQSSTYTDFCSIRICAWKSYILDSIVTIQPHLKQYRIGMLDLPWGYKYGCWGRPNVLWGCTSHWGLIGYNSKRSSESNIRFRPLIAKLHNYSRIKAIEVSGLWLPKYFISIMHINKYCWQ
jgi:hypothetical protein